MAFPSDVTNGELISAARLNAIIAAINQAGGEGATVTASAGAATKSEPAVKITSESLTTAAGSTYTLTLTNTKITVNSLCFANAYLGTSTNGTPQVIGCTPANGSVVIVVKNIHATNAFNGTIKIDFLAHNTA